MSRDVERFFVRPEASIRALVECIDRNAQGIALAVDAEGRLLNTVTDGDVRRGLLAGLHLDQPVQRLLDMRGESARPRPLTAAEGSPPEMLLTLMTENSLRHIPVVDDEGIIRELAFVGHYMTQDPLPVRAVVMAGGFGRRLRPLTEDVPKPMLPVGDRPVLEHILEGLKNAGVSRVQLTTHYKADVIQDHFGDGSRFGMEIGYVEENRPLGTAGALSLMDPGDEPLLVMNGDILTSLDFRAMLKFHREMDAQMTVGVRQFEISVPYGVVETDGGRIASIVEKPSIRNFVNAGIYLIEPEICRRIPKDKPLDMPDLVRELLSEGLYVACFPVCEYWLDVGSLEDYEKARSNEEHRKD